MNKTAFVERYGAIYEHSSWVAECVYALFVDADIDSEQIAAEELGKLMADCVDNAAEDDQLRLIRAHPDLAGKLQLADELTAESTEEQSRAGLDQCTAAELEQFQSLNVRYKEKFGFPFIMAVRNSGRADILAAFKARVENDVNQEFETALQEIHKIAEWRLAAMETGT